MWLANSMYYPTGSDANLGPEAQAFLIVLTLSAMIFVVVFSRIWGLRRARRREKILREKAVDVWAEVANSRGYEFKELGYQDMTINGQEGSLEIEVCSTDDNLQAVDVQEKKVWTRIIISHRDGQSLSDLELRSRDYRGRASTLDPMGLIFGACYESGDERDVNDQVPQRELRSKLLKMADKNANISLTYEQLRIERAELIIDREELWQFIDDALELVSRR